MYSNYCSRAGCNQERVVIKSGLKWQAYTNQVFSIPLSVSHKPFSWPQSHSPAIENTVKPPIVSRLPLMTPKNIPEQLRILGFNTLAALIGTADLTYTLQTPGPFTIFAPTDEAFEKFIGM